MTPGENNVTLAHAQQVVHQWITSTGVRYFSPLTNMAVLAEEVGEVARIIARTDGDQSPKPGEDMNLADELADVLWVVCAIANQHGIDLSDAFCRNLDKKNCRDNTRHKQNPKLYD